MKITKEIRLSQFEFWSGAITNASQLDAHDFHIIEEYLEENFIEPIDETWLNNFMWFEFQFIVENVLGYFYDEEYGTIER